VRLGSKEQAQLTPDDVGDVADLLDSDGGDEGNALGETTEDQSP